MQLITDTISGTKLGKPTTFRNLTVFPVFARAVAPDYVTLDEALAGKFARVTEVSEGGSVPELKLVNDSDNSVFLMEGEELVGAKQNRVLNTSVLIAARSKVTPTTASVRRVAH